GRDVSLTNATGVTLRGLGKTASDTLLDFSTQTTGEQGVLVTTDHFTVENIWIKNTSGNGIKVQGDYSVFRNIKVSWDAKSPDGGLLSGAYALYPTLSNHVLIEDNEVVGAVDAGIYAGECTHVIARGNKAHGNVLGIEIENTTDADVHDNDVYDNATGFLLDLLPNLPKKDA